MSELEKMEKSCKIGDKLRQARTSAGLEISDVAADLRINSEYLEALELNQFEAIGAPTYTKGYIRSYASALKLSPDALIEEYGSLGYAEPQLNTATPIESDGGSNKLVHLFSMLVLAVTLGLFAYWLFNKGYMSGPSASGEALEYTEPVARVEIPQGVSQLPLVDAVEQGDSENALDSDPLSTPLVAEVVTPQVVAEVVTENPLSVEPLVEPSPVEPASRVFSEDDYISAEEGNDEILLTLTQESWIEIEDAAHYQLMQGIYPAGTTKILRGQQPFQVFLGNAPGVELIFNDSVYNMTPHTRSNNTAKFALIN